ncbi:MAG: SDR family NAD(P)-dependent oxidoreductase [Lachnospiraceae bacterium]|nr:SDR family NAD(P)-dependent oxidoreductase [Lachnospiraceae bacterium]
MKIAIVTGASSGMGREFAREIAAAKHLDELWLVARRSERLQMLKEELEGRLSGLRVRPLALDLTKGESIDHLRGLLAKIKPHVKLLVNASGFGKYGTYQDLTDQEISQMIDLNCKSLVHITYAVLPYMKKGGRVLILGSASAFQPLPEFNLYASTKAFVVHFSRALNVELKSRRISVTCVCPGYVRTEFFQVAQDTKNPSTCRNFKPMYEPEDVVRKALSDSKKGRDLSVLGFDTKMKRLSGKLLPSKLVMQVWMKIK